jgi:uncharacterized protein
MNIRETSTSLLKVLEEISATFLGFQQSSGIHCPSGCSRCCLNPEIEASVAEMLPFALKAYDEGLLDEWLQKLSAAESPLCVLYTGQGCGEYAYRPSLCRMFGVAGVLSKERRPDLSVCKVLKEEHPQRLLELRQQLSELEVPFMADWSALLDGQSPSTYAQRRPINQAIRQALELVAFNAQYQEL